jgi:hypothetical protein
MQNTRVFVFICLYIYLFTYLFIYLFIYSIGLINLSDTNLNKYTRTFDIWLLSVLTTYKWLGVFSWWQNLFSHIKNQVYLFSKI